MVKEEIRILPNNIKIRTIWKVLYAWVDVDTWRSIYDLKDSRKLLEVSYPYWHKKSRATASKTSAMFINIKREHVEEFVQKLSEFLTNPDNLVELEDVKTQLMKASKPESEQ